MSEHAQTRNCVAYGPEFSDRLGRRMCFFEDSDRCTSIDQCRTRLETERKRVFRRINELAAGAEEPWPFLESEFTSPDQLLSAERDSDDDGKDGEPSWPSRAHHRRAHRHLRCPRATISHNPAPNCCERLPERR